MYSFYLSINVILCLLVCNLFRLRFSYQVVLYSPAFKDEVRILDLKCLTQALNTIEDKIVDMKWGVVVQGTLKHQLALTGTFKMPKMKQTKQS